ncbi:DUF1775 domain-containing protein [Micromonospora sp. NBC_01813]|uniref:DUF1775 domain-containing protein n=1 Tax=Micromonospora sp. NBC_01813 TaxID=2975988 RepID=UPI002DD9EF57|nr:DUF1775 domain-containing protein [Micromonospora sp. NBC_01813]WSA10444.1 YcnI family protein [Micromonospora sp. NBC_01813]
MVSGLGTGALRIGTVLFGAVVALTLAAAPAAAADIVLEPTQAPRGSGIMLTFQLPEERPGAHTTQVRLDLPADLPIAEVYPMSVDDWAPRIASRPLAEPLPGLHGGIMTEATESIVWQRVTAAPASAPPVRLSVSIGPLPDADRVDFTVTQAYSDGTEVRWGGPDAQRPAPSLVLSAADPAAAAGHGTHSGGGQASGDQGTSGPAAASTDNAGTGMGLLLAGLAGGALLGAAAVWWQSRRRAGATVEPADDAEPGPLVGAGSTSTANQWRLTER